jgi:hypothetical protein
VRQVGVLKIGFQPVKPVSDGASVPRDVADASPAQDPEVGAADTGEAAQVVQGLQRFSPALPRQRSEPAIEYARIAQGQF